MDDYTRVHLRELARQANAQNTNDRELKSTFNKQLNDLVNTAEQLCQCQSCINARANKTLSACELNKRMLEIHDKIIEPVSGNYLPELSGNPDDWFFAEKRRKGLLL